MNYEKIKRASHKLSQATESERSEFLRHLSREIGRNKKTILAANAKDVVAAKAQGMEEAFVARLVLDENGIQQIIAKLDSVARLQSGLGEMIERKKVSGLVLKKVRAPLGVLFVIYEARPEVTIDVAALCIKSGNAAILKGGSEALRTNKALFKCVVAALRKSGLPVSVVSFVASADRNVTNEILQRNDVVDLVIARGGYAMVKAVMTQSKISVLAHAAGGARIFVDKSADVALAEKVLVNAKTTKPAACNSLDTILVHQAIAKQFVPRITKVMEANGVSVKKSFDRDKETLGLVVGIKIVKDAEAAVEFIRQHGKSHSEGIIAKDTRVVEYFVKSVDAAAIFVNASTRLHDGYAFGLGSEMGISTSKLHARGPVGLKELTTYRWLAYGTGTVRKK